MLISEYFYQRGSVSDLNFDTGAKTTGTISILNQISDIFTPASGSDEWFNREGGAPVTDISKWQGSIDWPVMWSKTSGVVGRLGYGMIYDQMFLDSTVPAFAMPESEGKYKAVYHYMNTGVSASNQIDLVLRGLDVLGENVHAFWSDAEGAYNEVNSSAFKDNPLKIMQAVRRERPKLKVGLYTNKVCWDYLGSPIEWLNDFLFWYARYYYSFVRYPVPPAGMDLSDIYMWQYSAGGNGRGSEFGVSSPDIDISVPRDPIQEFLDENLNQGDVIVPIQDKKVLLEQEQAAIMSAVQIHTDNMIDIAMAAEEPVPLYSAITTGNLNVRSGPGSSFDKVGLLEAGTDVDVYEEVPGTTYTWARISSLKEEWVASNWLSQI